MKSKVIWALVALNALLLVGLLRPRSTTAVAAPPARGEYIMIPGEVVGGPSAVIYIIDEVNHKLAARSYDENRKQFSDMAPIDLQRVFSPGAAPK